MALFDFNPSLGGAEAVLDARKAAVKDRTHNWNYKKYAYCTVKSTGNSQTITCPSKMTIGDGSAPTGGGTSMYTSADGPRRLKPILTSCKITNEGGQNYVDSYIYEVEFSYTVYTKADLEKAINSFMMVGGEVEISFGWRNGGSAGNTGKVIANVYNFNFSMKKDGSFDCTTKAMSPSALFPKETMGGNTRQATPTEKAAKGKTTQTIGFFEALQAGMRRAHGLSADEGVSDADNSPYNPFSGGVTNNQMRCKTSYVKVENGGGAVKMPFWITEMLSSQGTWYNDDEMYFSYTNLNSLIKYINLKMKAAKSTNLYTFGDESKHDNSALSKVMFSADPTRIVLAGQRANYGNSAKGEKSKNFAQWQAKTQTFNTPSQRVSSILLELDYLNSIYATLADAKEDKGGGGKIPPTIQEFLGKLFNDIADMTGGLVQLQAIPEIIAQDSNESTRMIQIVNRPIVKVEETEKPYVFTTLAEDSIVRDVTLETDFDANTIMMATLSANATSTTNIDDRIPGAKCGKAAKATANADKITKDFIDKTRESYGNDGFDSSKVTSNADALKKFLAQNRDKFSTGYKEVVWPYKLGVTIDGTADINYMAAITVDRLPDSLASKKMYFSITSIEHTFNGQGDWETSLGTVMRIY